jgi:replication factor C small subunit
MQELWVEKYRPKKVNDYVFRDSHQKRQVESWIKDGSIPHLLFSGHAGIGKTTLAKVLLNELDIPALDILEINASRENNVDTVRDKIINFVQMIAFGPFKVVLLDEADYLTPNAQAILRGVMETYSNHSRFITQIRLFLLFIVVVKVSILKELIKPSLRHEWLLFL